jgi:predicted kinase
MWKLSEHTQWELLEKEFNWVSDMKGVPQDAIFHAEGDVSVHTRMVVDALEQQDDYKLLGAQDQHTLWASALLHDVEKRSTTVTEPDGSITSKGHAKKGALTTRNILYTTIPTPFDIREQVSALVRYHGLPLWTLEKPDPVKAVIEASLKVNTKLLALLARADVLGRLCADQDELLYKIDLFQALCEEYNCLGKARTFSTTNARFQYFKKEEAYPDFVPFDEFGSQVILMSGLPGSGKDTHVFHHYKDWPVINLDDIRRANKIAATDKSGNGKVIQMAKEQARVYLRSKQNFVWNATNITRQMREQLVDLFTTYKAYVRIVYVEVPYRKLHTQNVHREFMLPAAAVERLVSRLEVPDLTEAHDVEYWVEGRRQL